MPEQNAPPIAAVATPPGTGAISMVRVSGAGSHALAAKFFRSRRPLAEYPARQAVFGKLHDGCGALLDEVVLVRYDAPASYTGEDLVEICCHGGPLVTGRALRLFLEAGARPAEPGEFTLRAFLAGKMDLTQAEAVMDLISAKTPLALRAAAGQLEGRLGAEIAALRELLLGTVAHLEAWIDFPEEGIDPASASQLLGRTLEARAKTAALLATADEGRILREGVRLAICGRPNAGKSSLLNRLLGCDRAIVHDRPGTTRDTIEEPANLGGVPFLLIDTAGLRDAEDAVERQGIERARQAIARADVVLEVFDATCGGPGGVPVEGKPHLLAANKCDLLPEGGQGLLPPGAIPISCATGSGIPELVAALASAAGLGGLAEGAESPLAINARHQACLERASAFLDAAARGLAEGAEPELVAVDLRAALDAVCEVTGAADPEEILGKIFSAFCIGK